VVIAADDHDAVVEELTHELGIEVAYRDPGVAEFGLVNAVMPVGDCFLEVVSPVEPWAPARRWIDRRCGPGGYMAIFQVDDVDASRRRLDELGIRVVWKGDFSNVRGTHLHPGDMGGAIVSLDWAEPPESWAWAGPAWTEHRATTVVQGLVGIDVAAALLASSSSRAWLDRDQRRHGPVRRRRAGHRGVPLPCHRARTPMETCEGSRSGTGDGLARVCRSRRSSP
jgi:hypothetical protein